MRWTPLVLALGCSSHHAPESATPAPSNAVVPPAATPPADDAVIAVRVGMRGLDLLRVTPKGIDALGNVDKVHGFGWLDRQTLVTYDNFLPREHAGSGAYFQRVVGGKVTDHFELPTKSMGPGSLVITASHEAWFAADCVPSTCTDSDEFLRLWPEPRITHRGPPDGVIAGRATTGFADRLEGELATAPHAPSGATLSSVRVSIDRGPNSFEVDGVACESNGKRITVPDSSWELVDPSIRVVSSRWVSAEPPFFEVVLSMPDFDGGRSQIPYHYRGCETTTHQVQPLGDDLWAEHVVPKGGIEDGTWVFWNGATKLGSHPGGTGLRAAR